MKFNKKSNLLAIAFLAFTGVKTYAQGAVGIDAGAAEVATFIDPIANLILVIGGLVGFIGAIRVFVKWNNGDQDVNKAVMGWGGSMVFLIVSGIMVRAFFGV